MGHPLWSLFDLRLTTPRLELRLPTDSDLIELLAVAKAGIHDPEVVPFSIDWAGKETPEMERGFVQYHWAQRANWKPNRWDLPLVVLVRGTVIGSQALTATEFGLRRSVGTGSWLGRRFQGQGYGTEMRAAVLELAFAGLGAEEAHSEARTENTASLAVSRKLGYEPNGIRRALMGSQVVTEQMVRLSRDRWIAYRPDIEITIHGLDRSRELFGA